MQPISKVEQPTSPSSVSNYYCPPNSLNDLMQNITKFLEKGQQSALHMRTFLNKRLGFKLEAAAHAHDDHHHHALDHHTSITLSSFETCLSMIKTFDLHHHHHSDDHHDDDDADLLMIKKRKLDHSTSSDVQCSHHSSKSQETVVDAAKVSRERRGCYKRRRTGQTRTVEATNLVDDGFAWRKYGQKEILNTKYPRNYFRCTHKHDQECQATKQVQQISENPTKYTIIYHGQHTCKNLLKTPSIIIDDSQEENSSIYLSFETKTHPQSKHALTTCMFPSSAFLNNPTIVKQEHTPIKIETPLAPHDLDRDCDQSGAHIQLQYSSSSDNHPPSSSLSDLTSTGLSSTPVSEQGDVISSSAEIYSSNNSPYNMDDEELFSLINMDNQYPPLDDGFWNNLYA